MPSRTTGTGELGTERLDCERQTNFCHSLNASNGCPQLSPHRIHDIQGSPLRSNELLHHRHGAQRRRVNNPPRGRITASMRSCRRTLSCSLLSTSCGGCHPQGWRRHSRVRPLGAPGEFTRSPQFTRPIGPAAELVDLAPDLTDDLLNTVDQPLQAAKDQGNARSLCCKGALGSIKPSASPSSSRPPLA